MPARYRSIKKTLNIAIVKDITTRKKAEAELRLSEERYRTQFKNLPIPTYTWKHQGDDFILVDYNHAAEIITEGQISRIIGKTVSELYPENPQVITDISTCFKDQKVVRRETRIPLRSTGAIRDFIVTYVYVPSDLVLVHTEDITDKKQAEKDLLASENHYRSVISSMAEGIVVLNANGEIITCNASAEIILGLSADQMKGKTPFDPQWSAIHEDGSPFPGETHPASISLQTGKPCKNVVMGVKSSNGELHWILINSTPVFLENESRPNTVIATFTDITELKKVEAQLVAARDQLEQRVQERTAQLETAVTSLERAAKVKDEFLAEVSHELRTPLNGILGFAESLQLSVYGELSEKQGHAIEGIKNNGEHLLKSINTILDFTQIQSNILTKNLAPLSLTEACLSALKAVAASAEKKHQQASFSINPQDIFIQMDEQRLQQILLNLLSNAVKFTPENGKFGIEVTGDKQNKQVKIVIWDQGIGLKKEDQARIFHPFVQADSSLARTYEGIGLGLAVTKQLTKLFGGNIRLESTFGEGSRFIVTLPWIDNFQSSST
ncbi:MAG: PAS domain-containing sensor histidine kinase [Anaerolineales bacterium]